MTGLGTYEGDQWIKVRMQVQSTTLRMKVWLEGETEPDWSEFTDSSLSAAGAIGFANYVYSGVTNGPVQWYFDDLSLIDLDDLTGEGDAWYPFYSYRLYRTVNGERTLVAEETDINTLLATDWAAPTGNSVVYEITQYDGWMESIITSSLGQVFDSPIWFLVVPDNTALCFPLQWVQPGYSQDEEGPMTPRYPLGRSTPIVRTGVTRKPSGDVQVNIQNDSTQLDNIRAAAKLSRSGLYAVLKTGWGDAMTVKIGTVSTSYGSVGKVEVRFPYVTVAS